MTAIKERIMGRVIVPIKVENMVDLTLVKRGDRIETRSIEVEALVDTGATFICLSPKLIEKLGLSYYKESKVVTADGIKTKKVYRDALLTMLGRSCPVDVTEISNEKYQALVGYIPLEALDLVVDPKAGKVTFNPEHGDEMILDLL